jgi:hypothetical protein
MIELPPPIRGISKGLPVDKESPATSGYMNNVRPTDAVERRIRLGQRPGLDKWSEDQIGDVEQPIVAMTFVSAVS